MIKLNDNSLYVGQIKQLLHTFHLPQCCVGDRYSSPNAHFLLNGNIMRWDASGNAHYVDKYIYGKEYRNLTRTFPVRNLIYDRETHRYLGKYLRFLRDYKSIDLMSTYNCWDGELQTSDLRTSLREDDISSEVSFKNGENGTITYKVPISLQDCYTISMHAQSTVELCIYVENKLSDYDKIISEIIQKTYTKRKITDTFKYNPFEKITDAAHKEFIQKNINRLHILVKISNNIKTSIVVLEGSYISSSKYRQSCITYKPEGQNSVVQTGFDVVSQLLSTQNANEGYLLGDRLLEYLSGNVICPLSESYEISRIQKTIDALRTHNTSKVSIQTDDVDISRYKNLYQQFLKKKSPKLIERMPGIWADTDVFDLRNLIDKSELHAKFDCLGYVDMDVENALKGVIDNVEL